MFAYRCCKNLLSAYKLQAHRKAPWNPKQNPLCEAFSADTPSLTERRLRSQSRIAGPGKSRKITEVGLSALLGGWVRKFFTEMILKRVFENRTGVLLRMKESSVLGRTIWQSGKEVLRKKSHLLPED